LHARRDTFHSRTWHGPTAATSAPLPPIEFELRGDDEAFVRRFPPGEWAVAREEDDEEDGAEATTERSLCEVD
jgi:hypothetical protein